MRIRQSRRLLGALVLTFSPFFTPAVWGGERIPDGPWMVYTDPVEAGFDVGKLETARQAWEQLPSSAFMVVADGAVVAAWGDVGRRFMCHSVRKSFLSALYGIYWDQGKLELNKRLSDLGIDDEPEPLLETEKQARILDLLKARSGVFHPAAYAGRTDSQPRGSQGPGRYFAYNNWDFNTLVTIFEQETGERVFEAFDRHFARPLGMEDWRVSDGYYHYERDKSKHPAYPFRMSARDAARFGLLFTRLGAWGDERILSRHWVRRSGALYSVDDEVAGYGFMWWVFREPRFSRYEMFAALGVGNQMIAVLPEIDLVIVNRANTYEGEGTPRKGLLDLIEQVLQARTGPPTANPRLTPLEIIADPLITEAPAEVLTEFQGEWRYPPPPLGLPVRTTVQIRAANGHLVSYSPRSGTFRLYLQPDGWLHAEDSRLRFVPVRDDSGALTGLADTDAFVEASVLAAADGDSVRARGFLSQVEGESPVQVNVARAVVDQLSGEAEEAAQSIEKLAGRIDPREVEARVNRAGYRLLQAKKPEAALQVFQLNTRAFPQAFNTWDSLGEAHMVLGNDEEAVRCYRKSLELNPDNSNATEMIARIQSAGGR